MRGGLTERSDVATEPLASTASVAGTEVAPRSNPHQSPFRNLSTVAIGLLLSRASGLGRTVVFAALFGASKSTDAYLVASLIPTFIWAILLSNVASAAFMPRFLNVLEKRGPDVAWAEAGRFWTTMCLHAAALAAFLCLVAAPLVHLFAPGFNAGLTDSAVHLVVIVAWSLVFLASALVTATMLNAAGHFLIPAIDTLVANVVFVIVIVALRHQGISAAAYALLASTGAAAVLPLPIILRHPLRLRMPLWLWRIPGVVPALIPLAFTGLMVQASSFGDRFFGSQLGPGAVSALQYSYQLTLSGTALLGGIVATVLLPRAARSHARDGADGSLLLIRQWLAPTAFASAVLTAALFVCASPLIHLVYVHGNFAAWEAIRVTQLMRVYALAAVPLVLNTVLWPMLITRGQRMAIIRTVTIGVVALGFTDFFAVRVLGLTGLASGALVGAWVSFALAMRELSVGRARQSEPSLAPQATAVILAMVIACLVGSWAVAVTVSLGWSALVQLAVGASVVGLIGGGGGFLVTRRNRTERIGRVGAQ